MRLFRSRDTLSLDNRISLRAGGLAGGVAVGINGSFQGKIGGGV